ncbi:hypothetical protein PENSPDRAFT_306872 [Peniophora sp. CONT]|nr:hypothetical protein PENSPDRAFT_306872 [Peniophora sp. CONT]
MSDSTAFSTTSHVPSGALTGIASGVDLQEELALAMNSNIFSVAANVTGPQLLDYIQRMEQRIMQRMEQRMEQRFDALAAGQQVAAHGMLTAVAVVHAPTEDPDRQRGQHADLSEGATETLPSIEGAVFEEADRRGGQQVDVSEGGPTTLPSEEGAMIEPSARGPDILESPPPSKGVSPALTHDQFVMSVAVSVGCLLFIYHMPVVAIGIMTTLAIIMTAACMDSFYPLIALPLLFVGIYVYA